MTLKPFVLASFLLPLLACTSTVSTGSSGNPSPAPTTTTEPATPISAEQACTSVFAAIEQRETHCGQGPWSPEVRAARVGACVAHGTLSGVKADPARVAACVAALPSTMCLDARPIACEQTGSGAFLVGTIATGGACTDDPQCAGEEAYCGFTVGSGSCGRCVSYVGAGASCNDEHFCTGIFACSGGTCVLRGTQPGGACSTYGGVNDCIDGFFCKPNTPDNGVDGTCSPGPKPGEACSFGVPCSASDACASGVCATIEHVAPGAACDKARLCDAPALCFEGTCSVPTEHVTEGQPCTGDHDRCVAGLDCDVTCKKPSTSAGGACPCGVGFTCLAGACQALEAGATCFGPGVCGPDLYCKGWGAQGNSKGTCAVRVKPGDSCAAATQMESSDVCLYPYYCGDSGVCETIWGICQ
jgi:hypothetical protein